LTIIRILFIISLNALIVGAQGQSTHDLVEFFTVRPNKHKVAADSTIYPSKIIIAPIISYSPETNLAFGMGNKVLFKMKGSGKETRTSNMPISIQYTLNNQFIIYSGFEIFSPGEKYMLTGNILFKSFPQLYYGIGRDTPESNEEEMEFNQILIEPIFLKRMFSDYLFVGGGIRYNKVYDVKYERDGILENTQVSGNLGSEVLGIELALVYDSRPNLINSSSGWYAEFTYGVYDQSFGSSQSFSLARLDLRKYINLSEKRWEILAFQLITHFADDRAPLAELAYLGSEEIMRGYYEGRYIDKNIIALQTEYRRRIKGRLGGVVFLGVGDVAPTISKFTFKNLRPSFGFGLRFLLERRENLNLRFDWGFGNDTNNYYLNVSEAF